MCEGVRVRTRLDLDHPPLAFSLFLSFPPVPCPTARAHTHIVAVPTVAVALVVAAHILVALFFGGRGGGVGA